MKAPERERAVAAAKAIASGLGLPVDDVIVLNDSNRLALRLLPCDVLARVADAEHQVAAFEVGLAQRLAETECPVGVLDPRVEPRVYERDDFTVTLWTFYAPVTHREVAPADYASALAQLHRGMRKLDVAMPHFTDRVAQAEQIVVRPDLSPTLVDADRLLLADTLRGRTRAIQERGATEQLLHGEPHPGNLLDARHGFRFIDLETCCRGPVEFDLAHAPEAVVRHYPDVDEELLVDCRVLVLAMVAAWRWERGDQLPNGAQAGRDLVSALRNGPPWPTLDDLMGGSPVADRRSP